MRRLLFGSAALMTVVLSDSARSADLPIPKPDQTSGPPAAAYDWAGLYVGADVGYASGRSNWSATQPGVAPNLSGSPDFFRAFDALDGSGSAAAGLAAGINFRPP